MKDKKEKHVFSVGEQVELKDQKFQVVQVDYKLKAVVLVEWDYAVKARAIEKMYGKNNSKH